MGTIKFSSSVGINPDSSKVPLQFSSEFPSCFVLLHINIGFILVANDPPIVNSSCMTSSSGLFANRRSRLGRNSEALGGGLDLSSPVPVDRTNRRQHQHLSTSGNHARRDRLNPDGCDLRARRTSRTHPSNRASHPPQERETIWFEEGRRQSSSGDAGPSGYPNNPRDRVASSLNYRLPGAVLLARERVLQRLRGARLSNRSSSSRHNHSEIPSGDDFRFTDAEEWETEISREWLAALVPMTDSIPQQPIKRPPGLTQEALNSLCIEIFDVPDEQVMSQTFRDCSICLESFLEGDELIRLPCGHRYHFCCLAPWVLTCGDCPYCRRSIDVTIGGTGEHQES